MLNISYSKSIYQPFFSDQYISRSDEEEMDINIINFFVELVREENKQGAKRPKITKK